MEGVDQVFPTHVGVNRKMAYGKGVGICIPHARGGEPWQEAKAALDKLYSPRTWG